MPEPKDPHLPASEAATDVHDDAEAADAERRIDSDAALSGGIQQQGGAAIANLGKPRSSDLFKPD